MFDTIVKGLSPAAVRLVVRVGPPPEASLEEIFSRTWEALQSRHDPVPVTAFEDEVRAAPRWPSEMCTYLAVGHRLDEMDLLGQSITNDEGLIAAFPGVDVERSSGIAHIRGLRLVKGHVGRRSRTASRLVQDARA